jgi:tRNA threonylcarbamoyl adenosine modification protein YeaZ
MSIGLLIDTSTQARYVALAGSDADVSRFDIGARDDLATRLPEAIKSLLSNAAISLQDATFIAVNIGPGGLSATRSGVSFSNALRYGLSIPLIAIRRFEIIGSYAHQVSKKSVLCVQRGPEGQGFVAVYDETGLHSNSFGELDDILERTPNLTLGRVLIGQLPKGAPDRLLEMDIVSSDDLEALSKTFAELAVQKLASGDGVNEPVQALNESSAEFA